MAEELREKGISLTRKGTDYIINFELIDYKITTENRRKSETETEDFVRIDIPGYGITYVEGMPELPQISFSLAIPYDMEKTDFEVSSVAENEIKLEHKIYPTQYYFPDTIKNEQRKMTINDSIYSGKRKMELPFAYLSEPFIVSGVKGVTVTIFPFQYDPVRNSLTVREKGSFRIKMDKEIDTKVVETESMVDYLNSFFVNYGDTYNAWDKNTAARGAKSTTMTTASTQYPKGNYLFICPTDYYYDYDSKILNFIAHKESLGYRVLTYFYPGYRCVDFYGSHNCYTLTTNTEIKNVIQNYYNNPNDRPEYVLLVGDVAEVAAWDMVTHNGGDQISTDLPYAMLEGGPNDPYADVGFGRWSVTNVTELNNIIDKTIEMENKFRASSINPKRATLIADYDMSFPAILFPFIDDIVKVHNALINDGYSNTVVSQWPNGATYEITNSLNNGSYLACYSGHGSEHRWSGPVFDTANVSNLTNSIYPITFSFACHTGNFIHLKNTHEAIRNHSINNPCLGEKFIRVEHGACAFWGATRTVDLFTDKDLIEYVFTNQFHQHNNLSKITNMGIKNLLDGNNLLVTPSNRLVSTAAYNLLGDPSLQIRFKECPTDLKFYGGETDNSETLQYPISPTVSIGGNGNYMVRNGGNLSLRANNSIILNPGFTAQAGSKFTASITSTNCSTPNYAPSRKYTETEIDDDIVLSDDSIITIYFATADAQVYPNPFSDFFIISFNCYETTNISVKLFDIQGKLINFVADNRTYSEGKHEINIESKQLEKGMYLIKLTLNNQNFVHKLIKN